jgi:SOS-response transcriptional repressor LexA
MKDNWPNYKMFYKVDVTEHWFGFNCDLPCKSDAFHFQAEARVVYSVDNPATIVKRNVTDAYEVLSPLIIRSMRTVSRNHDVEEIDATERAITEIVEREIYDVGLRVNRCVVKLNLDENARAYIRKLRQIERDKELEKREVELQRQRDELEMEQMKSKMDFYSTLIKQGYRQLLALQLSQYPEELATIAQMLRQHHQAEIEHQLTALKMLLEKDALEDFQVEQIRKRFLQRFVENFGLESEINLFEREEKTKALPAKRGAIESGTVEAELENNAESELSCEQEDPSQPKPLSHLVGQLGEKDEYPRTVPLLKNPPASATQPVTEDNIEAQLPVNQNATPGIDFALHVQNDDLSQIGISAGDIVLIRQQDKVSNGDVVVIVPVHQGLETKFILRKVFSDKYRLRLIAEHAGSRSTTFSQEEAKKRIRIIGKVIDVKKQ